MTSQFPLYRGTTLGKSLDYVLDHMITSGEIRADLSDKVLLCFDKVICQKFKRMPDDQMVLLKATSTNYNNCDDVWRFTLKDCSIRGENIKGYSRACTLMAYDAVNNPIDQFQRQVPVKKQKRSTKQPEDVESMIKKSKK